MRITFEDIEKAVQQLKKHGVPDELFIAGVFPDGVYRIVPISEAIRLAQEKKEAAQS